MNSEVEHLDVNVEHLINRVLQAKIKNNDRDYSYFHPSEFNQCHRKLAYKYYETQGIFKVAEPVIPAVNPQLQRIFDNGHHVHYRLGDNLVATGRLKGRWKCLACKKIYGTKEKLGVLKPNKCDCESVAFQYQEVGFLDKDTMFGGHVDGILDLSGMKINGIKIPEDAREEHSHIIIDFKSIRSEAFRKLIAPKEDHLVQMHIYLYLSGLRCGKFIYENKNDQELRQFVVPRDEDSISKHVASAKLLKKIVTSVNSKGNKVLPMRAYTRSNAKECSECRYRLHCWGNS